MEWRTMRTLRRRTDLERRRGTHEEGHQFNAHKASGHTDRQQRRGIRDSGSLTSLTSSTCSSMRWRPSVSNGLPACIAAEGADLWRRHHATATTHAKRDGELLQPEVRTGVRNEYRQSEQHIGTNHGASKSIAQVTQGCVQADGKQRLQVEGRTRTQDAPLRVDAELQVALARQRLAVKNLDAQRWRPMERGNGVARREKTTTTFVQWNHRQQQTVA